MKQKTFKLSIVVLLLLFVGAGCQKDEWEIIELNDNLCGETIGVIDTFTDYSGIIDIIPDISSTIYFIVGNEPETINEVLFIACNLPTKYHQQGLEIIFSGEVLNVKDWVDGETQADYIGTPIKIINAKIKK